MLVCVWHRRFVVVSCLFAAASVAMLVAFRSGWIPLRPQLFAALVGMTMACVACTLVMALVQRGFTSALLCAGTLLILGGGLANWLFSLQGFIVLTELEAVRLSEGKQLQEFVRGALADVDELELTLQLEKLELVPDAERFVPRSRVRIIHPGRQAQVVETSVSSPAIDGPLRFHQGAFGFSPRVVVTRHGETLFDRHVPFTTLAGDARMVSFRGDFAIAAERLVVRGALDLESLDERMKGHPRLGVAVDREGRRIGAGELSMGHFASLDDGYAIGFGGLRRWSEIDITRRNYPRTMLTGATLFAAGLLLLPFRRRRR